MHASYCTYIQTTLRHGGAGWRREGTQKRGFIRGGERREEVREGDPGVNRETYPELPEPPVLTKGRHHHQSLSLDLLLLQDKLHTRQVTKRTRGEGQINPPPPQKRIIAKSSRPRAGSEIPVMTICILYTPREPYYCPVRPTAWTWNKGRGRAL